jgi:hypothetical protein
MTKTMGSQIFKHLLYLENLLFWWKETQKICCHDGITSTLSKALLANKLAQTSSNTK